MQSTMIRNKELSGQQLQRLRNVPQYLGTNGPEFILYNLVNKESNTGLFKNERLLILNVKNESISYLSKVPQGLIPFLNQEQVIAQVPKERLGQEDIFENNASTFACRGLPDKNGIEIKLNRSNKKIEWVLYFGTPQLMSEWLRHIQCIFTRPREEINALYHTQQPSLVNNLPQKQQEQHGNLSKQYKSMQQKGKGSLGMQDSKLLLNSKAQVEISPGNLSKNNNPANNIEGYHQPFDGSYIHGVQSIHSIKDISHQHEKQSDLNQFHENTPLGSFIRSKQTSFKQQSPNQYQHQPSPPKQTKDLIGSKYFPGEGLQGSQPKSKYFSNQREDNSELGRRKKILADYEEPNLKGNINESRQAYQNLPYNDPGYSKIIEDMIDNESHLHRSGIIKKNKPTSQHETPRSITPRKQYHTDWNRLYYKEQTNKSLVYFQFIKQCLKRIIPIIDELPYRQNSDFDYNAEKYLCKVENGIQYKLGIQLDKQESIIYQLTLNQPLVSDLYDYIDNLKLQFARRRQLFSTQENSQHPLVLLLEYKQVLILCRAIGESASFQPIKLRSTLIQQSIIQRMENATLNITSTIDFREQMRKSGAAVLDWGYLYKQSNNNIFRNIFLAEIYCKIFLNILRCQLFQIYTNFPLEECPKPTPSIVDSILSDCSLHLINRLFGNGKESEALWDVVFKQTKRLYGIEERRETVNENYLFYAIMLNAGMKTGSISKQINDMFEPLAKGVRDIESSKVQFEPLVQALNYQGMAPLFLTVKELMMSQSQQDSKHLLKLRDEVIVQVPASINYLEKQINFSLTRWIPYKNQGYSSSIYSILSKNQPSSYHYETAIAAVRWLMGYHPQEAGDLSFRKIEEIIYYVGKIPLVSRFYEAIAEQQFLKGDYIKGVANFQHSIDDLASALPAVSSVVLERRKKIADIYFQFNRREQCLKQLNLCKKICEANEQAKKSEYSKILIKLAKITLCMSRFNESINHSLECLKHLQQAPKAQSQPERQKGLKQFFQVAELLLRSFQLTRRNQESFNIGSLCLQRCKNVGEFKQYRRLFKIILLPYLKSCDLEASQSLLYLTDEMAKIYQQSRLSTRNLVNWSNQRKLIQHLQDSLPDYFKHLNTICDKIEKQRLFDNFRKVLHRCYESEPDKTETNAFIMDFFLVVNLVGRSFFQGLLSDAYYQ